MNDLIATEADLKRVREALQELYEFCCALNDFRPDSRLGRKVKDVLALTSHDDKAAP